MKKYIRIALYQMAVSFIMRLILDQIAQAKKVVDMRNQTRSMIKGKADLEKLFAHVEDSYQHGKVNRQQYHVLCIKLQSVAMLDELTQTENPYAELSK